MLKKHADNSSTFELFFQSMIWFILRIWSAFIFPANFRRLQIKNAHFIRTNKPAVIAMNHPNSFADPILFSILVHPVRPRFMARGDAFKPGPITWLLEQIGILPIFRIQDGGKEGLQKNDETYQKVNQYLSKRHKVIIFAEGLCVLERRLRPLKKGVPRMVFGAFKDIDNDQLEVIPVGLNYSCPDKFGANVFINVGEPIKVLDYWENYQKQPAKTNNQFLQDLEPRLKSLITHINRREDDTAVLQAETLLKHSLLQQKGYSPSNLEHDFEVTTLITEKINTAALEQPQLLALFKEAAANYFALLSQQKLRDWLIDPAQKKQNGNATLAYRTVLMVLGFPVHLLGFLLNALPFYLTPVLTLKLIKNREFYTSIALGLAMVLFLIWYIILGGLSAWLLPDRIWPALVCLIAGLSAAFSRVYYRLPKKVIGHWRLVFNSGAASKLKQERVRLIEILNKF